MNAQTHDARKKFDIIERGLKLIPIYTNIKVANPGHYAMNNMT